MRAVAVPGRPRSERTPDADGRAVHVVGEPERGSSSRYNLEGHPGKQGLTPPPPPGRLFRTEYQPQVPE